VIAELGILVSLGWIGRARFKSLERGMAQFLQMQNICLLVDSLDGCAYELMMWFRVGLYLHISYLP
jgi:hypothetical protein